MPINIKVLHLILISEYQIYNDDSMIAIWQLITDNGNSWSIHNHSLNYGGWLMTIVLDKSIVDSLSVPKTFDNKTNGIHKFAYVKN